MSLFSFTYGVEEPLPWQTEQVLGRGSILLPPLAAKLPGSDADSEGIESTSCFVIQDHQPDISWDARRLGRCEFMWSAVCSVAPHLQFGDGARPHLRIDKQ